MGLDADVADAVGEGLGATELDGAIDEALEELAAELEDGLE